MSEIEPVHEEQVPSMGSCCEIRFDALITMFDMAVKVTGKDNILLGTTEKQAPPQWFKSSHRLTLEAIQYGDARELGETIKKMFNQMDHHIKKFEDG